MAWLLFACLSLPHLLYAFIWFFPGQWRSYFHRQAVPAFERAAIAGKALQFLSVLRWYADHHKGGLSLDFSQVHICQWLTALALVGFGQALNIAIYQAIGSVGVYYGFKLGHKVPWHHGFPFNVVAHPQYVGSVITIWGLASLVWNQAPGGLGIVASYWTALYAITALQEQFL